MAKRADLNSAESALDKATIQLFAEAQTPVDPSQERAARMRQRVLSEFKVSKSSVSTDTLTIRQHEGKWVEVIPKVDVKQLYIDHEAGTRSFLMRLHPGAEWPAHEHTQAEECIVLPGEVALGDLTVRAGEYHLAPKGVAHGTLRSKTGALLFLRAGLADTKPTPRMKVSYLMRLLRSTLR